MELPDDDGSVEVGKAVEPVDPRVSLIREALLSAGW
jgi:hypothetical protein